MIISFNSCTLTFRDLKSLQKRKTLRTSMNGIRYHCDPFPSNTTSGTVGSSVGKSPQCHSGSNMKPFDIFSGSQHSLKQTNYHSFTSYLLMQRSNAPVRGEDTAPPLYLRGKADMLPFPLACTNQDVSDVPPPPWSPLSLEVSTLLHLPAPQPC